MSSPPEHHRLRRAYTLSYLKKTQSTSSGNRESYEKAMHEIGSFDTVEGFWSFYNYLKRPGSVREPVDFHVFQRGIKPLWEDPANKKGGEWIIRVNKSVVSRCWEDLILAVLGDPLHIGDSICGIVCQSRMKEATIGVWDRDANNEEAKIRLRDFIRRALQLPGNAFLIYRVHDMYLKALHRRGKSGEKNEKGKGKNDVAAAGETQQEERNAVDTKVA